MRQGSAAELSVSWVLLGRVPGNGHGRDSRDCFHALVAAVYVKRMIYGLTHSLQGSQMLQYIIFRLRFSSAPVFLLRYEGERVRSSFDGTTAHRGRNGTSIGIILGISSRCCCCCCSSFSGSPPVAWCNVTVQCGVY